MSSETLRVGWVGGLTRSEHLVEAAARRQGCHVEFHDGNVTGHRSKALRNLIHRSDVVVIMTELNSHRGVLTAREEARLAGRRVVLLRKAGLSRLEEMLGELRDAAAAA
ncbi:MAG: DUF2325 domain-containing protein [Myxococcales bacterium]|nr:MAG: DUF2325 domain-containing protein [Myxococcales bacterium]